MIKRCPSEVTLEFINTFLVNERVDCDKLPMYRVRELKKLRSRISMINTYEYTHEITCLKGYRIGQTIYDKLKNMEAEIEQAIKTDPYTLEQIFFQWYGKIFEETKRLTNNPFEYYHTIWPNVWLSTDQLAKGHAERIGILENLEVRFLGQINNFTKETQEKKEKHLKEIKDLKAKYYKSYEEMLNQLNSSGEENE